MDDLVVVGVVGKPFGLRGELYVRPDPDLNHNFTVGETLDGGERRLTVESTRVHSGRRIVRFREAGDRDAAEKLRGVVLRLPRSLIALEDASFWTADLLGAEVVDEHGFVVGALADVLDGPAHDYLVIARPNGGEVTVPAVTDLVTIAPERIVVRAIPGLLDADDGDEPGPIRG